MRFVKAAAPQNKGNPSLPGSVWVRGYEVKKMPLGAFLKALERIQHAPTAILSACFPGRTLDEILTALKNLDESLLAAALTTGLSTAAPMLLGLLSELSGVPEDVLLNDPAFGPDGIVELVKTVWEINNLKNLVAALPKKQVAPQNKTRPGSNG